MNRNLRPVLALGLVSLLGLTACPQQDAPAPIPGEIERSGEVLKTVNGEPVTQGMLDTMLSQLPDQLKAQLEASGQIGQMNEQLVIQEILYQKAVETNLHEDPEVSKALATTARSTLADAYLRRQIDAKMTPEKIQAWYDDHAVQFARPQVELAHIMVATEDEANAIKAQLDGGADFTAVAKEKSLDQRTAGDGGVIGWVRPADVGPLGAAVEGAEKGTIAGPVQSPSAWHVVKVIDTREKIPLEEVEDQIKEQLKGDIADEVINDLKEGATITDGAGGATVEKPAEGAAPAAEGEGK